MEAIHAYMADCTEPDFRYLLSFSACLPETDTLYSSRIFSLSLGLLFTGIALGPSVGGLFTHYNNNVISVFYFATFIHLVYAILIWAVVPESLTPSQRAASQREYANSVPSVRGSIMGSVKRAFEFLRPLSVFLPHGHTKDNPSMNKTADWSLTLLALAYGFTVMILVSISDQQTFHSFD
jgi:MFS family permease